MDQIKSAFQKVKQDMDIMEDKINQLNNSLYETEKKINFLTNSFDSLNLKLDKLIELNQKNNPTQSSTFQAIPLSIPTENIPIKPQKEQILSFSTGNEGVPTDRQTNQQTNQQTIQHINSGTFGNAIEVLNSLDHLKKEIKNKFKKITEQEFLVFTSIYQLSEKDGYTDYKTLSVKLNLTESSIRDYVGRLLKKEIPIEKVKLNNKIIHLSISENLKKIAPLNIILQLREV